MIKKLSLLVFTVVLVFSGCEEGKFDNSAYDSDDGIVDNTINNQSFSSNIIGTANNYGYEFWAADGATGTMTIGNGGTFRGTWNAVGQGKNILMRRGIKFSSGLKHGDVGNITVKYIAEWSSQGSGVDYLGVYGWFRGPLVEWYIIDDWGAYNKPPGSWEAGRTQKGTINVDGDTYTIWSSTANSYNIDGTGPFTKYWSVRTTRRSTGGTISVSEHFKKWESLGMTCGNIYEAALLVEGYNSSGSAKITKNSFIITQ
ncbi:MAG: glycoside hydrolase family 11 protein [Treponema sp.]|nr:glycoside hydrolase family 11 protein [Treponema sp.]